MEILEIQPDLQDVVLNADKKLSVQLRVSVLKHANCIAVDVVYVHTRAASCVAGSSVVV
jgi:hypothetical protein